MLKDSIVIIEIATEYQLRGLVCLCYVDPENECESIAVVDSPTEHPWKCHFSWKRSWHDDDEEEEEDHMMMMMMRLRRKMMMQTIDEEDHISKKPI